MANVSGNQLFDPFKKARTPMGQPMQPKQVLMQAIQLIKRVYQINVEKNKTNPFLVCLIHRDKKENGLPIHRWASFASIESGVHPKNMHNVDLYMGAEANAEAALDGAWYIASDEEEIECQKHDDLAREKALELVTQKKVGEAAVGFANMLQAANSQMAAKPGSAESRIKELEERLAKADHAMDVLKKQQEAELVGVGPANPMPQIPKGTAPQKK